MKKVVCLLLSALMSVSVLLGCGGNNDSGTLYIEAFDGGYKVEWLQKLVDSYLEDNPDKKVEIVNTTNDDQTFYTALESNGTTTDLYFSRGDFPKYMFSSVNINGTVYSSYLADLTDVFDGNVPGENIKVSEKYSKEFVKSSYIEDDDGNKTYYAMPWTFSSMGLIYNKKVWKDSWTMPKTTDELLTLCDTIKNDGCVPFIYSINDSYWYAMFDLWFAQYQGIESYNNFYQGYPNGDLNADRYQSSLLQTQGILESYKVLNDILIEKNKYCDDRSKTSSFTNVQKYFLDYTAQEKPIAMMPNGDWLLSEMKKNFDVNSVDIGYLKAPVISSIVDTLSKTYGENRNQKMSESLLSEVVAAIDNGKTSFDGVAAGDFDKIKSARNMYIGLTGHCAWVPAYSPKVDLAKDFLRYMTTDKAIASYVKATSGSIQPFNYDYEADEDTARYLKTFNKEVCDYAKNGVLVSHGALSPNKLFALGGLKACANSGSSFESYFSASNANDYKSPEEVFNMEYNYVNSRWSNILNSARLV